MSTDELQNSNSHPTSVPNAAQQPMQNPLPTETDSAVSNSNSQSSQHTHQSGSHRSKSRHSDNQSRRSGSSQGSSGTAPRHKGRKSAKRNNNSYRASLWSRISAPILQCRRCGERYRSSWTKDTRCPKCGRHPVKVQPWESALYTLVFPAAVIGALVHFRRSPRNAVMVSAMGIAGLLVEGLIYLVAK